jgi:hypothetical protein
MAIDYGGVSGLAQAVLAINLAYVALDRFRYKAEIERRFANTQQQLPHLAETSKSDLAYKYLEGLGPGRREAWGPYLLAHFFYVKVFEYGWDRKLSHFFSLVAILVLLMHAYYGLIVESAGTTLMPAVPHRLDWIARWVLLIVLIAGIVLPGALLLAGRYTIKCVIQRMMELEEHLGSLLRVSATEKVTATEQELGSKT